MLAKIWRDTGDAARVSGKRAAASTGPNARTVDAATRRAVASVLTLGANETHIALVEGQAAEPTDALKVRQLSQIANADFYMLRFVTEEGTLLAVRKTNAT